MAKNIFSKINTPAGNNSGEETKANSRPFSKINFILIGCSILLIVIGFIMMTGEGSSVEKGFNPDIFSTRRITAGPALAFLGFLSMAFAIIYSPKKK